MRIPASVAGTPVAALTIVGMNDVINLNGYTQAAWWNRDSDSGMRVDGCYRDLLQLTGCRPILLAVLPWILSGRKIW